jgi:hypothetical protein
MGLDVLFAYKPTIEAHPENSVILAVFVCPMEENPRHKGYKCHRKPVA